MGLTFVGHGGMWAGGLCQCMIGVSRNLLSCSVSQNCALVEWQNAELHDAGAQWCMVMQQCTVLVACSAVHMAENTTTQGI
jgi:hypothetical protein|mmetsp:Transcript_81350/g.136169  ORF Transcript_81350/g.136169 Transcript_81350/m.136169 type:complete len:81 (-) Transcript_81350:678-920(-)